MPYFYCFYSYKAAELQGSANTNPEQTRLRDAFPSNMLVIKRVSYIRRLGVDSAAIPRQRV